MSSSASLSRSSAKVLAFAPRLSFQSGSARPVERSGERLSTVVPFPKREVVQFYAATPEIWRAFLVEFFDGDEIDVAQFFRVSNRGARKWLDGDGSARLDKLLLALTLPGALDWWQAALPALRRAA